MKAWNSLIRGLQFGYEGGKIVLSNVHSVTLLALAPLVTDDILEVAAVSSAISICTWVYLKTKRQLREAEMLARAWRIDATKQQGDLFAERMQNLRLQQIIKEINRGN